MMVEINFDLETYKEENQDQVSFGPLDPGQYLGRVLEVKQETSQAGHQNLVIEFQTDKGRVWDRLNLWHPKPNAVNIAKRKLAEIATALGMGAIKDTEELLAKELKIEVIVEQYEDRDGNQKSRNEVVKYLAADLPSTAASAPPPVGTGTSADASSRPQGAWNG